MGTTIDRYAPIRHMGARFGAGSVAELYRHRPPYSAEVSAKLFELLQGRSRIVLDMGCGPGKLARELAPRVERVDALDASGEMIRVGRGLPGGAHPNIHWMESKLEEAPLGGPYGLACAGASFHWFDPDLALERLAEALEPGGVLVLIDGDGAWRAPWADAEVAIFQDFGSRLLGRRAAATHEALGELVPEFDAALRAALEPHARDGRLAFQVPTRLEWGRPIAA